MTRAHVRALQAMRALSEVELGLAALDLADRQDALLELKAQEKGYQDDSDALQTMHDRLSQPGQPLQPVMMHFIAHQAHQNLQALRRIQREVQTQNKAVQSQQLIVQHAQARHDNIGTMTKEARREVARERALKEALEVEDLYVATLHRSKELA